MTTQTQASRLTAQNVKNNRSQTKKKQAFSRPSKSTFSRTTFRTKRDMDFFSARELVTQTGHDEEEWPLVFLKEAIDNALDACEETDTPPIVDISADACGITVADNGPGLPEDTLKAAWDFTVRVSNREAYVAPDRGAQGNALKTLLPMPHVIDPEHGRLIIEACGKRHSLVCGADPISQQAVINDDVDALPTKGTKIHIEWAAREWEGEVLWPFDDLLPQDDGYWEPSFADRFREMIEGFAIFNPHATFRLDWFGTVSTWQATDTEWLKWKPSRPTSPHWYELEHLQRLIGAYVTHDAERDSDRLVTDFLAEFDGLSGSKKRTAVLEDTGLRRAKLSSFVVDGKFDADKIAALLSAMKRQTKPVTVKRLGIIGEKHLRERLLAMGVLPESFRYTKKLDKGPMPGVLETAFGWLGEESEDHRRIYAGANWSAAINNPFRSFGTTGEGLEAVLTELKAGAYEPIVFVMHLANPRTQFTDRGKSALVIGSGEQ